MLVLSFVDPDPEALMEGRLWPGLEWYAPVALAEREGLWTLVRIGAILRS
jgi:hypothetical protein